MRQAQRLYLAKPAALSQYRLVIDELEGPEPEVTNNMFSAGYPLFAQKQLPPYDCTKDGKFGLFKEELERMLDETDLPMLARQVSFAAMGYKFKRDASLTVIYKGWLHGDPTTIRRTSIVFGPRWKGSARSLALLPHTHSSHSIALAEKNESKKSLARVTRPLRDRPSSGRRHHLRHSSSSATLVLYELPINHFGAPVCSYPPRLISHLLSSAKASRHDRHRSSSMPRVCSGAAGLRPRTIGRQPPAGTSDCGARNRRWRGRYACTASSSMQAGVKFVR